MSSLHIHSQQVTSIFQLLGRNENDISKAIGFTLSKCSEFLKQFLKHLGLPIKRLESVQIQMQEYSSKFGFTDFELMLEGEFHIIIEAKRGWIFPELAQLNKYATRPSFVSSTAKIKKLVVFNESTPAFTKANFHHSLIGTVAVDVVSYRDIQNISRTSIQKGKDVENYLLRQLDTYLNGIITMQNKESNWVYIVSLGAGTPDGWSMSWRDIVNVHGKYFHPVGGGKGGWPAEPPNYIAFRYNGQLQSIHHIERFDVFTDPSLHFKGVPSHHWGALHYLYHLGPAIKPPHVVKTGSKIPMSLRVWAMLDLLLTSKTIQDARDESKRRAPY